MSFRLELSGFRLDQLQSLFGSGRQAVIDAVEAKFERAKEAGRGLRADLKGEAADVLRASLRDVIHGGVPLPALDAEYEPHAQLVDWLAHHEQKHRRTDCDIKAVALRDFRDQYGKAMGTVGRELFGFLVNGRPLLGPRFRPESPLIYGYLTRGEAGKLSASFKRLSERESPPEGDWDEDDFEDLVSDFAEWLDELRSNRLDVWSFIG